MDYNGHHNGASWDNVLYVLGVWTGFVSVVARFVLR